MAQPRPPSVDALLRAAADRIDGRDRDAVLELAREVIDAERRALSIGTDPATLEELVDDLGVVLAALDGKGAIEAAGLEPAINATGVILHTNLGRAPWARVAIDAAVRAASVPSLLELDPSTGRRGRRFRGVESEVIALTGAEDALVTTNNAAAVAIAVGLAGRGGGVVVSRGELVEIGGGVRIPEIVRRAGAKLVEVGTTNRTRVADIDAALEETGARVVLRVHPSNFQQSGFVETPDASEVAAAAHARGAIVIDDLGSGALLDTQRFGLAHEPTPRERLESGADLVTFSGDKLIGGPQAGILAGRTALIERLRRDPLARAMRPDKVILAALAATLRLYRAGTAATQIPIWRQIATPARDIEDRAKALLGAVALGDRGAGVPAGVETRIEASVEPVESTIGGGSLPGQTLPSFALVVRAPRTRDVLEGLRSQTPSVIGRIVDNAVVLDLRTVDPADDEALVEAIRSALEA